MANTYTLIEAKTLGSAVSSVTFSSIPNTYTDLKVVCSIKNTTTTAATYISFNSSTSNFTGKYIYGNGNGTVTSGSLGRYVGSQNNLAFNSTDIYIPNYAGSNYKSFSVDNVDENNGTDNDMNLIAGLWSDISAITSIDIVAGSSNMGQYSTFYLYGISNS